MIAFIINPIAHFTTVSTNAVKGMTAIYIIAIRVKPTIIAVKYIGRRSCRLFLR